jgi:hypothetical protein
MQKLLMTAGVVLALGLSVYSVRLSRDRERDMNHVAVTVANVDRLISLVENLQTNQFTLVQAWDDNEEMIAKEIKDRQALQHMAEHNAEQLKRISENLERDYDKMYTNIVMFGVSVFAAQENVTALAVRLQDLERRGATPTVPAKTSAKERGDVSLREKFGIEPAPTN